MIKNTIAILGAGSWGTAIAIHLAQVGHSVMLWGKDPQHIQLMIEERANTRYLPGIIFPESLTPETDLNCCVQTADYVIVAVPSHAFSEVLEQISVSLKNLIWITKGIDPKTHHLLSDIVAEKLGKQLPIAVVSGPSFAKEVARFLPTALTLASNNDDLQQKIHRLFHHENVRVYLSHDLVGVQLCGAVKNVLAIACGISDGLGYGANAKAALITRGLAEMSRLGIALGAKPETFLGLAGLGDLVLTCTDNQSRNRRFGLLLGQNVSIDDAEKQIGQVVEGKHNAEQVCVVAHQYQVEMPICEQINALLQNKIDATQAVSALMSRPFKKE